MSDKPTNDDVSSSSSNGTSSGNGDSSKSKRSRSNSRLRSRIARRDNSRSPKRSRSRSNLRPSVSPPPKAAAAAPSSSSSGSSSSRRKSRSRSRDRRSSRNESSSNNNGEQKVCPWYQRGLCRHEQRCKWKHIEPRGRSPPRGGGGSSRNSSSYSSRDSRGSRRSRSRSRDRGSRSSRGGGDRRSRSRSRDRGSRSTTTSASTSSRSSTSGGGSRRSPSPRRSDRDRGSKRDASASRKDKDDKSDRRDRSPRKEKDSSNDKSGSDVTTDSSADSADIKVSKGNSDGSRGSGVNAVADVDESNDGDSKERKQPRCAYVCLVMKGDSYTAGALVAGHSLRRSGTSHAIVCMVTDDVSAAARGRLSLVFDRVVQVPYLRYECHPLRTAKQRDMYAPWVNDAFTKWNMLTLTDYDKVMFVDADKVILSSIDSLFDLPTPAGTFSSPWAEPWVKGFKQGGKGMKNPYVDARVKHGEVIPRQAIDDGLANSFVVIGTVLILQPSLAHFEAYKAMLSRERYGHQGCFSMMDEQSITDLYHSELKDGSRWTYIHQQFNSVPWKVEWLEGKKPRLFHYFNKKPWDLERSKWLDCEAFWQMATHLCARSDLTDDDRTALRAAFKTEWLDAIPTKKGCAWCKEQLKDRHWDEHNVFEDGKLACPRILGRDRD